MVIAATTDFREAARRLPPFLFHIDSAAYGEVTCRNVADLARVALHRRILSDVSEIKLGARRRSKGASLFASRRCRCAR